MLTIFKTAKGEKIFTFLPPGSRVFTMVRVEEDQLKIEEPGAREEPLTTLQAGEIRTNFEQVPLEHLNLLILPVCLFVCNHPGFLSGKVMTGGCGLWKGMIGLGDISILSGI